MRALDQHDGGVRNVDTDLDDGAGDEYAGSAAVCVGRMQRAVKTQGRQRGDTHMTGLRVDTHMHARCWAVQGPCD